MQSTTTTTVEIDRTIEREIMGGDYTSWSGSNVTPSSDIAETAQHSQLPPLEIHGL